MPEHSVILAFNTRNQLAVRHEGKRSAIAFRGNDLDAATQKLKHAFSAYTPPTEYYAVNHDGIRQRISFSQVADHSAATDASVVFASLDKLLSSPDLLSPDLAAILAQIDPLLIELNSRGALNGHVPVTAIVSCVAMLTAALHGFNGVALANERSASSGNRPHRGTEVNHQFSKGFTAEMLLQKAVSELTPDMLVFSVLRMASELAIARSFSRLTKYHPAFTSCNRIFHIDPTLRTASWCCDCDKCRFVFLILAPFLEPEELERIFGAAMLDDMTQFEGFKLLATVGDKPFECVGEERESAAAIRLLAADPRWQERGVVKGLATDVLPGFGGEEELEDILALSDEHSVPPVLLDSVDAILGS